MSDTFVAAFAERYGLERLKAADPAGFAAALDQTAKAGAAMTRPEDKESGPAPVFRLPARDKATLAAVDRASSTHPDQGHRP